MVKVLLKFNNLNDYSLDTFSFLYSFGNKHNTYEGYMQQDFHEFCRIYLDDINKELNENIERLSYIEINITNKISKLL